MSPFLTCFPRLLSAKPFGWGHTRHAHVSQRRLIMPLVALVQKNHSAPATSYFHLVLGARYGRRHCSSNSVFERVSAYLRTHRICEVHSSSHHNCEHSEQYSCRRQYNWRSQYNFLLARNITAQRAISLCKTQDFCKIKRQSEDCLFYCVLLLTVRSRGDLLCRLL